MSLIFLTIFAIRVAPIVGTLTYTLNKMQYLVVDNYNVYKNNSTHNNY